MASISTSLNSLLATNFSNFGRIGQGVNRTFNATQPPIDELRQQLGGLKEGTTISARYDYRVGANGQLVQTGSTIKVGEEEQRRQQQQAYTQADERQQTFADLAKPRADLSPSDELALFASEDAPEGNQGLVPAVLLKNGAEDEDGTAIDVELITPGTQEPTGNASTLDAQRQQRVSALYARNHDIQFTVNAAITLAA